MSRESLNNTLLNFVHLTDSHLGNNYSDQYKGLKTFESLRSVCLLIQASHTDLDFILVTGDISQTGTKESYALFQSILAEFKIPVYCLPGNHDDANLIQSLYPDSPVEHVSFIQLKRTILILINTAVLNEEFGFVKPEHLSEISNYLDQNPSKSAIVAMHHPVISTNTPWMDKITVQNAELVYKYFQQQENIKLVLNGHAHMDIKTKTSGTTFISTPSTCYQFKPGAETTEYDTLSPAYRLVSVEKNFDISTKLFRINLRN